MVKKRSGSFNKTFLPLALLFASAASSGTVQAQSSSLDQASHESAPDDGLDSSAGLQRLGERLGMSRDESAFVASRGSEWMMDYVRDGAERFGSYIGLIPEQVQDKNKVSDLKDLKSIMDGLDRIGADVGLVKREIPTGRQCLDQMGDEALGRTRMSDAMFKACKDVLKF